MCIKEVKIGTEPENESKEVVSDIYFPAVLYFKPLSSGSIELTN